MTMDEMRQEIEQRMGETLPSVGCEVVLALVPARNLEIAERLEPALAPTWEVQTEFHRTTDDGHDLYFHRVLTHNDRVPAPELLEFGERFEEIDKQLKIEQVREQSPDVYEETIESLGRERAFEFFGDLGGGENLVQLRAMPIGGLRGELEIVESDLPETAADAASAEVLLRVDFEDLAAPEDDVRRMFVDEPFMGWLWKVERVGETEYLLLGTVTNNVSNVRAVLDHLSESAVDMDPENATVVCRSVAP